MKDSYKMHQQDASLVTTMHLGFMFALIMIHFLETHKMIQMVEAITMRDTMMTLVITEIIQQITMELESIMKDIMVGIMTLDTMKMATTVATTMAMMAVTTQVMDILIVQLIFLQKKAWSA